MNPNIETAVAKVNEQRNVVVEAKMAALVQNIDAEQKGSAIHQKNIDDQRVELGKISGDVFTVEGTYGGAVPAGANQATITKVIEDINKGRQSVIESRVRNVVQSIANSQEVIRKSGEAIAKYREELAKLKTETITATEVAGS